MLHIRDTLVDLADGFRVTKDQVDLPVECA